MYVPSEKFSCVFVKKVAIISISKIGLISNQFENSRFHGYLKSNCWWAKVVVKVTRNKDLQGQKSYPKYTIYDTLAYDTLVKIKR